MAAGRLVEDYEDMRGTVLLASAKPTRPHGLALFLGRGMSGWMKASEVCAPPAAKADPGRIPSAPADVALPPGLHGDVANLLAEMVLSNQEAS